MAEIIFHILNLNINNNTWINLITHIYYFHCWIIQSKVKTILKMLSNDNLAYICWMSASIFWVLGFVYPNQHKIDIVASNLSRGAAMYLFNAIWMYFPSLFTSPNSQNSDQAMGPRDILLVSIRHLFLTVYGFAFSQAQFYLPSPIIYTIYFSGPLFVVVLEYIFLKRKVSGRQSQGIITALIGVMLTANGNSITTLVTGQLQFQTQFQHYKTDSVFVRAFVALLVVFLTFGWAAAIMTVRMLQNRNIQQLNINFGVIMTFISGILFFMYPHNALSNQPWLMLKCMLFSGSLLSLAQHFFMIALVYTDKTGITTMVGFVGLVFSYFLSVFRYSQPLNGLCLLGTVLVAYGAYKIVIS